MRLLFTGYDLVVSLVRAAPKGGRQLAPAPQRFLNYRQTGASRRRAILLQVRQSLDKVVVTGGAGFIGSHLVDRLLDLSAGEIVVFDNLSRGRTANLFRHRANQHFSLHQGDIRDPAAVLEAFSGATLVYHLAAQHSAGTGPADAADTFAINATGTLNVLRCAQESGVRSLVFASSSEVYGETIDLPVSEGQPLLPVTSLGASKVVGEVYCRLFRRSFGLNTALLRLTHVYGQRDFGRMIPNWCEAAAAGRDLNVDAATQLMDFVSVDQVVEGMIRAASAVTPLPPINLGSGTGTLLVALARRIIRANGGRGHVRLVSGASATSSRFVASVDRMRQLLGLDPPDDPLWKIGSLVSLELVPQPAAALAP